MLNNQIQQVWCLVCLFTVNTVHTKFGNWVELCPGGSIECVKNKMQLVTVDDLQ